MDPYTLTTHDGKTVDYLTHRALREVERRLGYSLTVVQGSYNAGGVAASGGTHDGGGVVDLAAYDWERKVEALRSVGFAAWYRSPSQGPWKAHIHAVLIGNKNLSSSARGQVADYIAGRNGLASDAPDDGPRRWVDRLYNIASTRVRRVRLKLERSEWEAFDAGRKGASRGLLVALRGVPRR